MRPLLGFLLLLTLALIVLMVQFGFGWRTTVIYPLFAGYRQNLLIGLALLAAILLGAWLMSLVSSTGGKIGIGLVTVLLGLVGIVAAAVVSLPVGLIGSERLNTSDGVLRATITRGNAISSITHTLNVMRCDGTGVFCRSVYVGRADPEGLFIREDETTGFIEIGSGDVVMSVFPPTAPPPLTLPPTQVITRENLAELTLLARVPMGGIRGLAWSPDGTTLVVGASRSREADADNRWGTWLFDTTNLAAPRRLTDEPAGPVAFHPDGTTIATNLSLSETVVVVTTDGTVVSSVPSNPAGLYDVDHVQYSADGRYLGHWGRSGTMQIAALDADGAITEPVAFSMPRLEGPRADDYLILPGEPLRVLVDAWDRMVLWNPAENTINEYVDQSNPSFALIPDGAVVTSNGWVGRLRPPDTEPVWEEREDMGDTFSLSRPVVLNDMVLRVFVSEPPRLYDLQTGDVLDLPSTVTDMLLDLPSSVSSMPPNFLALNPAGTVIAMAAGDGTLRFYGVSGGGPPPQE